MESADFAAKVANLESIISRLDKSFDRIEFWLFVATAIVVFGVIVEFWDDIRELRSIRRRARSGLNWPLQTGLAGPALRAVVGGVLVTIGVAWELVEEVQAYRIEGRSRADNAEIVALLTDEARTAEGKIAGDDKIAKQAANDAAKLGVNVGNLHDFVTIAEGKIDTQFKAFQMFDADERKQTAATLVELSTAKQDLENKRADATVAAKAAQQDVAQIESLLAQERELRQKIAALTTARTLSDDQVKRIGDAIKPFAKTPFDLSANDDPEAIDFVGRIALAMRAGNWDWKNWESGGVIVLHLGDFPGSPNVGTVTIRGIVIQILQSDRKTLEKPVLALAAALQDNGVVLNELSAMSDAQAAQSGRKPGSIHIMIGTRL